MKKIIAMLLIGTLLVAPFSGCERKEPAEPPPPEPAPEAKQPTPPPAPTLPPGESNPEAEKAAVQAADAWLKLLDSEEYSRSWEESAEYVKALVNNDDWQKRLQGVRQPLGKMISRELKSTHYTTTAPGAPDGQYVIIQYDSSFENKKTAVETVTPMLDTDGQWRVSGYYIR